MKHDRTGGRAVEPPLESIWPFLALVIVLVALALMDFLFVEPAHASRVVLLVLRIAASIALLMLAGITLRRLFIERSRLAEALAASEERLVSSLSDIRKRTQAEALLFEEKERAQVTLASIADAVVTVDTAGRIEFLNPVAERLTGWPLDEARQRPVAEVFAVVDEATGAPIADPVRHALTDGAVIEADGNVVLLCRGAESIAIDYSVAPIRDRGASIVGAVLVIQDMSRERQYAARLSNLASHDALTGLLNRREFEQRVRAIVEHHDAEDGQHAVLYLDLDQFKVVNDTSGHAAGDELLRQVGALLRPRLREGDVLARLGGDEFGVLLPHCPPAPALRIAEALRKAIVDFRFAWKNRSFTIGVSIGLVNLADGPHTLASALSAADAACYLAKDKGRNRVQVYRPEDSDVALRRGEMEWVHRLHRALAEDRLCLFSQPIRAIHAPGAPSEHQELLVRLIDEQNVCDQHLGRVDRRRPVPRLRARKLRALSHTARVDLLRDHGNDRGHEPVEGGRLHRRAARAGLPLRARRFRRRRLVVHVPQATAGRLPEDRRQLRQEHVERSRRRGDGRGDPSHRPRDGQADDRRVGRNRRDARRTAQRRRRLRAGPCDRAPVDVRATGNAQPSRRR